MSKLGRELSKIDAKITQTLLNPPTDTGFWLRRWPSLVDRHAELVEQGVWRA